VQGNSDTGVPDRALWKCVWSAPVPNKIKIFGWRAASDNLPTQHNKWRRTLEVSNICPICGVEAESSFHAIVACTKAKAIRQEMRKIWNLPSEKEFHYTGKDWILLLLAKLNKKEQGQVLLLLWRAWFLRDDIIHEKGTATIKQSVDFLKSYAVEISLDQVPCFSPHDKGKMVLHLDQGPVQVGSVKSSIGWTKPSSGCVKVNVDASFAQPGNQATLGVIARDEHGNVCFSAARVLPNCSSAREAELEAIKDGLSLAATWTQGQIICETDCLVAASAINKPGRDLSQLCHIINDIKDVLASGVGSSVVYINRTCNHVAHSLASSARVYNSVGFWLGAVPTDIEPLLQEDCNVLMDQ
jgi:hypothetical protein